MKLLRTIAAALLLTTAALSPGIAVAQQMPNQPSVTPSALATVAAQAAAAKAAADLATAALNANAPQIYISFDAGGNACFTVNGVKSPPTANCTSTPTPVTGVLIDPSGNACFKAGSGVYPATSGCAALFSALTGGGGGNSGGGATVAGGTPTGFPPQTTLTMNGGFRQVSATWAPVVTTPQVSAYAFFCGNAAGAEGFSPVYVGPATTYTFSGLASSPAVTPEFCHVIAQNANGKGPSSAEASATSTILPNTGASMAALYPGLLGSNGGANVGSTVPTMPTGYYTADYSDTAPTNHYADWNAWANVSSMTASLHTGQQSEADFRNSIGNLGGGAGNPRVASIPLIWNNTTNGCTSPGANLAAAAAGTYNTDYTYAANQLLAAFTDGVSGPRQTTIVVRPGWEFNSNNGASCAWYSGNGNQTNYSNAYHQFVLTFRAAETAFTPPAGVTKPHFLFDWCWLLDGDDPRPSRPPVGDYDMEGPDVYVQPGSSYDSTDPDTQFARMQTTAWGLNFTVTDAATNSKLIAFPEVGNGGETSNGIGGENWGQWWKLLFTWMSTHNVDHATIWNSNGGGYPGQCFDSQLPETCHMLRHFINPTAFPVEAVPFPMGITGTGGNGSVTFSATAAPSSANATGYNLYCGSTAGAENKTTPVQSQSTPSFALTVTNGTTEYCQMATVNSLGNVGFLSPEAYAMAQAPPANTPAYYVALGAGVVSTPYQSAYQPSGNFTVTPTFSVAPSDLVGTHPLYSIWGPDGYSDLIYVGLKNGQPYLQLRDNANHVYQWTGTGAIITAGQWYTMPVAFSLAAGSATFSYAYAGSAPVQTGAVITTGPSGGFTYNAPSTNPGTGLAAAAILGGVAGGGDHFAGSISQVVVTNGATTVLHPVTGATSVTDTSPSNPVWTLSGSAAIIAKTASGGGGGNTAVTFNWSPSTQLTHYKTALTAVKAGTAGARATILAVGDSTTAGFGSAATNFRAASYPSVLTSDLTAAGIAAQNDNFTGDDTGVGNYDTRVTLAGGAALAYPQVPGNYDLKTAAVGDGFDFTIPVAAAYDRVDVNYVDQGAGTISVAVDGGTPQTITVGATGNTRTTTLTIPAGAHSHVAVRATSAATTYFEGVSFWRSTAPKVQVINAGIGGATAASGVTTSNTSDPTVGYGILAGEVAYHPNLVLLNYGINDINNGVPLATTTANLTTIINAFQGSNEDVVLIIPEPIAGANYTAQIGAFRTAIQNLATSKNVGVIDLSATFNNDYTVMQGLGELTNDNLHPDAAGYSDIAGRINTLLAAI